MPGEYYKTEQKRQEHKSSVTGIVLTIAVHCCFLAVGTFTGLKYLYPPPEEESFVIDFSREEERIPLQEIKGTRPEAVNTDPEKDTRLVQASQAQHEGNRQNEAPEAVNDDFGDVETAQPPRKKEIDRRALFHAADNKKAKDTLAAQTAAKVSGALKAGHAAGNTKNGSTDGEPNADVAGRSVVGALPKPDFTIQNTGIVVVSIKVDRDGTVIGATPGVKGTTVTDKTLWEAARKAAMKATFNRSDTAPVVQNGTITYKFTLKK